MATTGNETPLANTRADVAIRIAVSDDAAALARFAELTFRDTFGRDNTRENMDRYVGEAFGVELQSADLADPRGVVLLLESGDEIMGYAQLHCGPSPAEVEPAPAMELQRFYIAHEYHGLGLAQRLMNRTLELAAGRGATTVWLGVWERNARAIAFYRKLGFLDVGSQLFVLGDDQQTDRIMCRASRG